jgi:GNAT superfamily N-acetyltransferase
MQDESTRYHAKFSVPTPLAVGDGEPSEHLLEIRGKLLCTVSDDSKKAARTTVVGRLEGYKICVEEALNHSVDLFDVCDSRDQSTHELANAVFDWRLHEFKADIDREFQPIGRDILVVHSVTVNQAHRGRGLGLALVSRFMDVFDKGCGLVVLKPFPLQFQPKKPGARLVPVDSRFARTLGASRARLRSYWNKLGFIPWKRMGVSVYCPENKRPSLSELDVDL